MITNYMVNFDSFVGTFRLYRHKEMIFNTLWCGTSGTTCIVARLLQTSVGAHPNGSPHLLRFLCSGIGHPQASTGLFHRFNMDNTHVTRWYFRSTAIRVISRVVFREVFLYELVVRSVLTFFFGRSGIY